MTESHFFCPHCGARLTLPAGSTAARFRCGKCGQSAPVPAISATTPLRKPPSATPDGKSPWAAVAGLLSKAVVIAICVLAVAAAIGGGIWHFTHRGPDTDEVATWVKNDMQRHFDTDPKMSKYRIQITDMDLIKTSDVEYHGFATVLTSSGSESHNVPIDVTYGDDKAMWEAERGAFLFLLQERIQEREQSAP